jgi:hypothetical protein
MQIDLQGNYQGIVKRVFCRSSENEWQKSFGFYLMDCRKKASICRIKAD